MLLHLQQLIAHFLDPAVKLPEFFLELLVTNGIIALRQDDFALFGLCLLRSALLALEEFRQRQLECPGGACHCRQP
ncbi:hypothetical protein D3C73_1461690 [compost metagenome]